MIFQKDSHYMELEDPSQYPVRAKRRFIQAKEMSASGVTHIEDFGVETGERTYSFVDMSNDDYLLLMDWFVNISIAQLYEFQLTDDLGVTATGRFTEPELQFETNALELWNGSFTFMVTT